MAAKLHMSLAGGPQRPACSKLGWRLTPVFLKAPYVEATIILASFIGFRAVEASNWICKRLQQLLAGLVQKMYINWDAFWGLWTISVCLCRDIQPA